MATSIFFLGRVISSPGSYSVVDASGLEQVGLSAAGIIAVLGEGEGGKPVSAITESKDFIRLTKPEQFLTTFRSGPLYEVGDMLFAPSNDEDVPGGAQEVVCMKVNPATQSAATLSNGYGDALDLTSKDYGAFTEQVNITIADGTTEGKLVTIVFEDVTEAEDNIGGENMFTLTYDPAGVDGGWTDAMTAQVLSGGSLSANGSVDHAGLDGDILTQLGAPGTVEVLSDSASDTGKVIVLGVNGSGAGLREELTLDGTTPVVGTVSFTEVYGFLLKTGVAVGNITVRASGGGSAILTIAAADKDEGAYRKSTMYVAGTTIDLVADAASTAYVVLLGKNAAGAVTVESVQLNGTSPVTTTASWSSIDAIALANVAAARTVTFSGEAARSVGTVHTTVLKSADYFNARNDGTGGFTFDLVTGLTSFLMDDLDVQPAAVSILDPAAPGFTADLWAVMAWINQNSQYIEASKASGASGGAPDNVGPVFLSGGSEGTTTFADYQNALNLLKKVRINTVVALTGDTAVHAAVNSHCAYMGGIGRNERDACLGALNAGLTDVPSKTEYKAQVVDLNSRHIRLLGQAVERYNRAGERVEFLPPYTAAIAAGMQAGSAVGESLTFKYANVLSFRQSTTWNPTDDAEEMIQAGAMFMENVEGVGRRWVRNITTHLSSNNVAFTEASVNEAVNYSVYNFRTNMEFAVGKKGFTGTINAAKGVAINTLGLLVSAEVLVQFRALSIELVVDVMEVSVEIAPVIPINFVKSTVHLVTVVQTAA